jgi:glycerol-3-phosphate dehydrogenase
MTVRRWNRPGLLYLHSMRIHDSGRRERLAALGSRAFDLLVIGGGITGCGIARDAALRGLSVALVEKDDFASGTSSRSSRLVHGGVRYLEHGHIHLVFESSAERRRLLRLAPHLVRPLLFTWPVYAGARIPRWKLDAGLTLYDALALFQNVKGHRRLTSAGVLANEPMLRADGLVGGAAYFDAATNDARLTLANALSAMSAGAIVLNHAGVTALHMENGRIAGATVRDALAGGCADVRAAVVVNATGPWSDQIQRLDSPLTGDRSTVPAVRGSKGAHIAVPRERIGNVSAVTLVSPRDGRVMFVLPAESQTIVGTTDTYTSSLPDDVRATNDDVQYLVDSANAFFPAARLSPDDVVSAWAGIRPLLPAAGDTPGGASREHAIATSPSGLISVTGGKLTTYRVMAADVVHVVFRRLGRSGAPNRAKSLPLYGGDFASLDTVTTAAVDATDDRALAAHLVASYGCGWSDVWREMASADGRAPVEVGLPYTVGELRYCMRAEMADTLGDLLIRRTQLAFAAPDHGVAAAARFVATLDVDPASRRAMLSRYSDEVDRIFSIETEQTAAAALTG